MGWIITLIILFLLAILPLGAKVLYNSQGFFLDVIAGPLRIPILPGKPKDPTKKKEKPKKSQKKPEAKPAAKAADKPKEKKKGGSVTDFLPLVKTALDLLNALRKKLRINHLELNLILSGGDPCDLGINYGRANAAMGNLLPQLEKVFVIKKRDIQIQCDFEASETTIYARADITITLGWLLAILVYYGIRAVRQFFNIKNKRKGGASS